jgi:Zn-dependent peptidase ImmA (M78 family)
MKIDRIALRKEAEDKAIEFRKLFDIDEKPIHNIFSLAFAKEFFILKFPFNEKISGAYIEKKGRNKTYKCIYINKIEPIGRIAFSFMHEIYHAYYEKSDKEVFSYTQSKDAIEIKANEFASFILIPRVYLIRELNKLRGNRRTWTIENYQIFDLQKIFNVSFLAIVKAITDLEDENLKPINLKPFYKYIHPKYWKELEELTLQYDAKNQLNSCEPIIEWPKGFKENIEKNIKEGIVFKEEVEDIFEFFDRS